MSANHPSTGVSARGYRWPMSEEAIRASDGDRDQVAELLHAAYAEGRITDEEHRERLEATLRAKTFGDLLPLTADLVPAAPMPAAAASPVGPNSGGAPDRMTAALSEVRRRGSWRVHRRSYLNVFMGSMSLDLTEAIFEAPVVEINVTQLLGSILLRVPAGTTIRNETASVLADTSIRGLGRPDPRCPTLVLRGTNILGEIKIRGPKTLGMWKRALT